MKNTVLFVCEHGSAKSVVAAAHFNRLAREAGLPYHAIARGWDIDDTLSPNAVNGLEEDGLATEGDPIRLSPDDVANADKVIAFGEIPSELRTDRHIELWNVPPVSGGYDAARTAIVERIRNVIASLK